MKWTELGEMETQYAETALWSSMDFDKEDTPLDDDYGIEDIDTDTLKQMVADCADFHAAHHEILDTCEASLGQIGHDFWLTRCRHGAGFWDKPEMYIDQKTADMLSDAARVYGNIDLMPDGNGKVVE